LEQQQHHQRSFKQAQQHNNSLKAAAKKSLQQSPIIGIHRRQLSSFAHCVVCLPQVAFAWSD